MCIVTGYISIVLLAIIVMWTLFWCIITSGIISGWLCGSWKWNNMSVVSTKMTTWSLDGVWPGSIFFYNCSTCITIWHPPGRSGSKLFVRWWWLKFFCCLLLISPSLCCKTCLLGSFGSNCLEIAGSMVRSLWPICSLAGLKPLCRGWAGMLTMPKVDCHHFWLQCLDGFYSSLSFAIRLRVVWATYTMLKPILFGKCAEILWWKLWYMSTPVIPWWAIILSLWMTFAEVVVVREQTSMYW